MVIGYFYAARAGFIPMKTEPPLVVNANAVSSCPVALKRFKPVARRNAQILQYLDGGQHCQFFHCLSFDTFPPDSFSFLPKLFGILAGEGMNHPDNSIAWRYNLQASF